MNILILILDGGICFWVGNSLLLFLAIALVVLVIGKAKELLAIRKEALITVTADSA